MNQDIKEVVKKFIKEIIDGIKPNYVFDSHYVIHQLETLHKNEYENFRNSIKNKAQNSAHGLIAIIIGGISNDDSNNVEKLKEVKSLSVNINGNISECTAWLKLK